MEIDSPNKDPPIEDSSPKERESSDTDEPESEKKKFLKFLEMIRDHKDSRDGLIQWEENMKKIPFLLSRGFVPTPRWHDLGGPFSGEMGDYIKEN